MSRPAPTGMRWRLAELFGRELADPPPVLMRQFRAMRNADATTFLGELGCIPTLVVSATHARIAPPLPHSATASSEQR